MSCDNEQRLLETDGEGDLADPERWDESVARHVIKFMAEEMGLGKAARNHLFRLFPYGYVQQACKIAGMKRSRGWSTG